MDTRGLSIGEVSGRAGIPASTLRYWESTGLLSAPERVAGRRRYDPETVRLISLITLLKRAGFTLAETRVVLDGLSERSPPDGIWRALAQRKLAELQRTVAQATATIAILEQGLQCDCLSLQDCLTQMQRELDPGGAGAFESRV